jgi:hypothetical protein
MGNETTNETEDTGRPDHRATHRLTHGQIAAALRLGAFESGAPSSPDPGSADLRDRMPPGAPRDVRAARPVALVTIGVLCAGTLVAGSITSERRHFGDSGYPGSSMPASHGSLRGVGSVADPIRQPDTRQGQQTMFSKLSGVAAATAVGVSTTIAGAQGAAMQWRASDGGNGHWYGLTAPGGNWHVCAAEATARGGHLATLTSAPEAVFAASVTAGENVSYIGARQDSGSDEPFGGWRWITGEPWGYESWHFNMDDAPCGIDGGPEQQQFLWMHNAVRQWDDVNDEPWPDCPLILKRGIIEWSADCNNDGIVDYGQCHDGTLPDYDGDNVPDCCEHNEPCEAGSYPLQWRVQDGGNGHWYVARRWPASRTWEASRDAAAAAGGHLACLTSAAENDWVGARLRLAQPGCAPGQEGWFLGGYQDFEAPDYVEPGGGWRWITGEPWAFTAWLTGVAGGDRPNNFGTGGERYLKMSELPYAPGWDDVGIGSSQLYLCGAIVEWSADCNGDGEVDFGQTARREIADLNRNNVPDSCECLGDLYADGAVNGADLGALLAYWGPVTGAPASDAADIDRDGVVSGGDLGIVLSNWGSCTN